jgi:hypothetical protein
VSFLFVVRPEVDVDLREAELWYEKQRAGLGLEFLQAIRRAMLSLLDKPLRHAVRQHRRDLHCIAHRKA